MSNANHNDREAVDAIFADYPIPYELEDPKKWQAQLRQRAKERLV